MSGRHRVEVVRGQHSEERSEHVLRFWADHGALQGDAARQRLPQVVRAPRRPGPRPRVNSAFEDTVGLIAGRRFWVYRRFLGPGADDGDEIAMVVAAFDALAVDHEPGGDGPVGMCLYVEDPEFMRRHPEAVWPGTDFLYAG